MKYKQDLPIYDVSKLNCRYGEKVILDSVSFALHQDSVLVILGPGGSGKTTLLNILSKDHAVHGADVHADPTSHFPQDITISYLKQKYEYGHHSMQQIFEQQGLHIAEVAKQQWNDHRLVRQMVEQSHLNMHEAHPYIAKLAELTLFFSLSKEADLILLDEPEVKMMEHLDMLVQKIGQLKEDKSVVVVTHNMEFTEKIADYVMFLSYGKLIKFSKHKDFFGSDHPDVRHIIKMGA